MKCALTMLRNVRIAATLLLFVFLAVGTKAQTMSPSDVAYCQAHRTDDFCLRSGVSAPQLSAADVAYCQTHPTGIFSTSCPNPPAPPSKPVVIPTPAPIASIATVAKSDCKTISFAVATPNGVRSYSPGWVDSWLKKNAKKYPNVCFAQNGGQNAYVVILSTSHDSFAGLQVVRVTTTTPFSGGGEGDGTVTDNYGDRWRFTYTYTYSGTVTTSENVAAPYEIDSRTLYATAYDSRGNIVAESSHVYSSQTGGDPYSSLGYNLGGALAAINARGRMLTGVVTTVAGR